MHSTDSSNYNQSKDNSTTQNSHLNDSLYFLNKESYGTYSRPVAKALKSLNAAVMLSELIDKRHYHLIRDELIDNEKYGEGWFYHTQEAVEDRTCLNRREQDTALKILQDHNFIEMKVFGVPAKRHFRINDNFILEVFGLSKKHSTLYESAKLVCTNPPNCSYSNEPKEEPKLKDIAQTAKPLRQDAISFSFETSSFSGISQEDIDSWKLAYPCCDITRELERSKQWLLSNPSKSRGKSLWRKYITNWLNKSNEEIANKQAYQANKSNSVDRRTKNIDGTPIVSQFEGLF